MTGPRTDGCHDVPAGKIAAVVTFLEMTARPSGRPAPDRPDLALVHRRCPDLDVYRELFRRIGTRWLWYSRLRMDDAALAAIVHDPLVEVHVLHRGDAAEGLLELDFRRAGEVELAFFGLTAPLLGGGAGRWLMERAITLAWRPGVRRFWVHTCDLDHPAALAFYVRSGFRPYRRAIDIDDDPRLTGVLPRDAAPDVPIMG